MSAIPDALADAIGIVIRQQREEWARERRQIETEARATIAELRGEIIELKATLKDDLANVKDGRDGKDGIDGPPGPQGEPGLDGEGVNPEFLISLVHETVAAAVAALPPPEKGEQGVPGLPGDRGEKGERGDIGPAGRDAADIAGGFVNRDGHCIITLSDGRTLDLGEIVGKDGAPGRDGVDGKNGQDGRDGLSFDAFELEPEWDGERCFTLRWSDAKGNTQSRKWKIPFQIYRDVWKSDARYEGGDLVRFGGSLWLATASTDDKPGDGAEHWRLVARAGRDGRDGAPGERGPQGPAGPPGPPKLVSGKD